MMARQGIALSGFWRLFGGLLLTVSLLAAGCGEKSTYAPPPPPKVTVSQPLKRPVTDYLEFTGNTQAINTVTLRARVQGYLGKVFFKDGERVKEGQVLFLIQQNTYEAQLLQAEAQILQQQANLDHAIIETERYSRLVKLKAAAQTDLDNWRSQRDSFRAAVVAAQANRDLAKLNLGYTKVTAPFSGRIDRRLVDPGNLVGAGEFTPLAQISQIDPIYVYFNINEKDLFRVIGESGKSLEQATKEKLPVLLGLVNEPGYPYQGHLDFSAISVTPSTGTLLLRGIFPNPSGLILPGLFARVRVPIARERQALMIPQVAVGFDQQGAYVLVVDENQAAQRRGVTLGPQVEAFRVIEDGLKESEWVVTNGLLRAIPGRKVSPEKEALKAPGGQKGSASPKAGQGKSPS